MFDRAKLSRYLEDIGRIRLSTNFFFRDFLHSEIAAAFGIVNRPDDLGLAVEAGTRLRSEEHTSELQSLMRISYAVFCLKKKKQDKHQEYHRMNTQKRQ